MIKQIVGGLVTVAIGGTAFTISQSDVTKNFADETGMSQQQAKNYVNNTQNNLKSFSEIGKNLVTDGNSITKVALKIDCVNYQYKWETSTLSCNEGKSELQTIGNDEIDMGNCYIALNDNLGNSAKSKMSECIQDIDTLNSSYELPIAKSLLDKKSIEDTRDTNLYNKSVLKTALNS